MASPNIEDRGLVVIVIVIYYVQEPARSHT